MLVSSVVDLAARRTRQAARGAAESRTLADLASAALAEGDALGLMLERLRETFALRSVTLFERHQDGLAAGRLRGPGVHRAGGGRDRRARR